ncbi:anti-sigma regulatory factor (Ser/Thr protein kinase) [Actinokineospora baliensis]|uniref:ATP-binding protein n=1 Tax=Actinokineospora baliensis TaxID=547056 RepID=UPI00195D5812|nr:ATP-binding protein [Actinokineospora baliensis]MBM7774345.1 anti-sigma regulatory factor (Ser/Thr protein kinase) [Actinokineospora baliensis]
MAVGDGAGAVLRVEVTAHVQDVGVVRAALRAWLTARHLPPQRVEDILLAVDEAVTNSVEHAYRGGTPGPVVLTAMTGSADSSVVRVAVADRGQWRPPVPPDRAVPARGRGLAIIQAIAAQVRIDHGTPGTTTTIDFATHPVDVECGTAVG